MGGLLTLCFSQRFARLGRGAREDRGIVMGRQLHQLNELQAGRLDRIDGQLRRHARAQS
jgi:hypothetical protein